jgi:toxin ParE1/3/4
VSRILFTELAETDIDDIWIGIASDNEVAADRMIDGLHATLRRLARFPGMGRAADHLRSGARAFVHGNYIIVSCPMHDGIAVLRIAHGARNIELIELPPAPREVREPPFIYAQDVLADAAKRMGDMRLRISRNQSPMSR